MNASLTTTLFILFATHVVGGLAAFGSTLLGLILVGAGASHLVERRHGRQWQPPPWVLWTLLAAGGIIHGAFGNGGATLTVYGRYALKRKEAFRGTLSIMWVVLNVFVIAGLIAEGEVDREIATIALSGTLTVLAATLLGHRLAETTKHAKGAKMKAGQLRVLSEDRARTLNQPIPFACFACFAVENLFSCLRSSAQSAVEISVSTEKSVGKVFKRFECTSACTSTGTCGLVLRPRTRTPTRTRKSPLH